MKQKTQFPKNETLRYAIAGMLFGLLFPVGATLLRILSSGLPFTFSIIVRMHSTDLLLWIIDTAPLILGLFASFAGRRQDILQKTNMELMEWEKELKSMQSTLEQRVEQRTDELSAANQKAEKRAQQLQSIADISRTVNAIRNFDKLLPALTQMISNRFGYYHVGIFLTDESRQFVVLRAANSPGGLRMLEQNERHRIGQEGTIGMVAQSRQARVISDTLAGIDFIDKSNLLETRSQATFPLKSEAELIGVMDIQATDVNAFSEDDMSMLTMLADQVSVAIQTALLFEQSQRALHEAEIVSGLTTELTWRGYAETIDTKGYRYDGITSEPLKGQSTPASENNPASIPVRLRGQVIGRLNLRASDSSRQWTEDELAMIEATASRVALAIEGARLLGEAKNRAERETFLSEIGTKLGSSFQLDSILRDTVEELGKTFKDSTVSFQLVDPTSTTPAGLRSTRNASERKNKTE